MKVDEYSKPVASRSRCIGCSQVAGARVGVILGRENQNHKSPGARGRHGETAVFIREILILFLPGSAHRNGTWGNREKKVSEIAKWCIFGDTRQRWRQLECKVLFEKLT